MKAKIQWQLQKQFLKNSIYLGRSKEKLGILIRVPKNKKKITKEEHPNS